MMEKRANMTKEEKEKAREKERLRSKERRETKKKEKITELQRRAKAGEFAHEGEYCQAKDKRLRSGGLFKENKKEMDKRYKKEMREQRSEAYHEFDRIDNLLTKRRMREKRCGKLHLLDNLEAKRGMRDLREYGPVKGNTFMTRASRDKDGEVLWRGFWDRGEAYQNVLLSEFPILSAKFKEQDEEAQIKAQEAQVKAKEKEKRERELDAAGRWVWQNGDYLWSIPDENGHMKSMSQYEYELECNQPKLTPEEEEELKKKEEEKRKRDKEMWRKHDEEMERWYEQERKEKNAEIARKQRERRKKQKEALLKPINLPKQIEKGDYEKARDKIILERHNAMRESGMFKDNELESILATIL